MSRGRKTFIEERREDPLNTPPTRMSHHGAAEERRGGPCHSVYRCVTGVGEAVQCGVTEPKGDTGVMTGECSPLVDFSRLLCAGRETEKKVRERKREKSLHGRPRLYFCFRCFWTVRTQGKEAGYSYPDFVRKFPWW